MDILVIEDEPEICSTIRLGWPVPSDKLRFVSTYRQSLNLTQSAELRFFDAVVLDIYLPDGDGMTILRTIRHSTDTPIILISGHGDAESRASAINAGADDYVMKPFSVRELQARVARLVAVRHERQDSIRTLMFKVGNVECSL
ncbi:MAG TPA: response regulator, partial [Rhizobiaceae bacterium]|nr:response regulator [Rhizobiaceae bacterium]